MFLCRLPRIVSTRGRPRLGPSSRRMRMAASNTSASSRSSASARFSLSGWNSTDQDTRGIADNFIVIACQQQRNLRAACHIRCPPRCHTPLSHPAAPAGCPSSCPSIGRHGATLAIQPSTRHRT
jgi:hypothetical protein